MIKYYVLNVLLLLFLLSYSGHSTIAKAITEKENSDLTTKYRTSFCSERTTSVMQFICRSVLFRISITKRRRLYCLLKDQFKCLIRIIPYSHSFPEYELCEYLNFLSAYLCIVAIIIFLIEVVGSWRTLVWINLYLVLSDCSSEVLPNVYCVIMLESITRLSLLFLLKETLTPLDVVSLVYIKVYIVGCRGRY